MKHVQIDSPLLIRDFVNIKSIGAIGDGITDDTNAFVQAFKSNRTVVIPPTNAFYKINAFLVYQNLDRLTINAHGAKILNTDLTKATFLFQNCTNININGGDWGQSVTPTANGGNSQHIMQFDGCQHVVVDHTRIYNSPEMGVAITNSFDVEVKNSTIETTFRDGTYSHASARIKYINNTYKNIKDDAMSFHDYGHASDRALITSLGYTQANDCIVDNCRVDNAYQGFASVAGSGISITNSKFKNTVLAGIALMNQKLLYQDGTSRLKDVEISGNVFVNNCKDTLINNVRYTAGGQGSSGRAAISVVSLGDNNGIDATQPKRQSNVRIHNNFVDNCGALGMVVYNTDQLILGANLFKDCTVTGNTLGGNVVELVECFNFSQEGVNTVIDTRTTVQHGRGYSFSGVYGTMNDWVVINRTIADGVIANSPQLKSIAYTASTGNALTSTNDLPEGSNNKYYTDARVVALSKSRALHINVMDYGATGDGTTDDTVAIQAAITAQYTIKKPIYFPAGTYKISSPLIKAQSFDGLNMFALPRTVLLLYTGISSGASCLTVIGGSGAKSQSKIEGFIFKGNVNTIAITIDGQCNQLIERCTFQDNAEGVRFFNNTAGAFTEQCIITNSNWERTCKMTLHYKRTIRVASPETDPSNGTNSFHYSGLGQGNFIDFDGGTAILIDDKCLPYNCPLNVQLWDYNDTVFIKNNNTGSYVPYFHGNVTFEHFGGTVTLSQGIIYFMGNSAAFGDYVEGGDFYQCKKVIVNKNNSTVPFGISFDRQFLIGNTAFTPYKFTGGTYQIAVSIIGTNYDYRYVLLIDSTGGPNLTGSISQVVNTRAFNTAGYGEPVFTQDAQGKLVITNTAYPTSGVNQLTAFITVNEIGNNIYGNQSGNIF